MHEFGACRRTHHHKEVCNQHFTSDTKCWRQISQAAVGSRVPLLGLLVLSGGSFKQSGGTEGVTLFIMRRSPLLFIYLFIFLSRAILVIRESGPGPVADSSYLPLMFACVHSIKTVRRTVMARRNPLQPCTDSSGFEGCPPVTRK